MIRPPEQSDPRPGAATPHHLGAPYLLVDLDGTLLIDELIPTIASQFGLGGHMRYLTERAMNDEVPFSTSFASRVDMLVSVGARLTHVQRTLGTLRVREGLLRALSQWPTTAVILTSNLDAWVGPLGKAWGLEVVASEAALDDFGEVVGVTSVLDKATYIEGLDAESIFVGDGANDLDALRAASIGIAFGEGTRLRTVLLDACDMAFTSEERLCGFLQRWL